MTELRRFDNVLDNARDVRGIIVRLLEDGLGRLDVDTHLRLVHKLSDCAAESRRRFLGLRLLTSSHTPVWEVGMELIRKRLVVGGVADAAGMKFNSLIQEKG